jgi:hypothetical protein
MPQQTMLSANVVLLLQSHELDLDQITVLQEKKVALLPPIKKKQVMLLDRKLHLFNLFFQEYDTGPTEAQL